MDNTASCMIEVCDLHKHYKDVHVLRGISTTVAEEIYHYLRTHQDLQARLKQMKK